MTTFRYPLLFISIVCTSVGLFQYFSQPYSVNEVFHSRREIIVVSGEVTVFTPSKGTPRIKLKNEDGKIYFLDCMTGLRFCEQVGPKGRGKISAEIVHLKGQFYWPLKASYLPGGNLSADLSKNIYEIYREREWRLYKFWLLMALAFLIFTIWFGNRPLSLEK